MPKLALGLPSLDLDEQMSLSMDDLDEQITIHASQENAPETMSMMMNDDAENAPDNNEMIMNADAIRAAAELAGDLDSFTDAQPQHWSMDPQPDSQPDKSESVAHGGHGIIDVDDDSQITEPGVIADSQITDSQIPEANVDAHGAADLESSVGEMVGSVTRPGCVPTRAEMMQACSGELAHIKLVCGAWLGNIELNKYTEKCLQDVEQLAYDASVLGSKLDEAITSAEINADEVLDSVAQLLRVYQGIRPTAYSCMRC